MKGIEHVIQDESHVEICLHNDVFITLSQVGMEICQESDFGDCDNPPANLDWSAAEQLALTILTARGTYDRS